MVAKRVSTQTWYIFRRSAPKASPGRPEGGEEEPPPTGGMRCAGVRGLLAAPAIYDIDQMPGDHHDSEAPAGEQHGSPNGVCEEGCEVHG